MKYYSTLLVVQTPFSYTCKFGQYAPFKTNTTISNSSTKCNNSAIFELEHHGDLRFAMEVHSDRLKKLFFIFNWRYKQFTISVLTTQSLF